MAPAALALLAVLVLAAAPGGSASDDTCGTPTPPVCTGPPGQGAFMKGALNSSIYDHTDRPRCREEDPTIVEVQLGMTQLNSIDQKRGVVSVSGYLKTWWHDPRLVFNGVADGGCFDKVVLVGEAAEALIWRPDIYLVNGVDKRVTQTAITVYPDGTVYMREQVSIDVKNHMDFSRVPYDEHEATFVFASYTKDITQIRMLAKDGRKGPGPSGVGISSVPVSSKGWSLPEGAAEKGFESVGFVRVSEDYNKDYLTVSFPYARKPKFLEDSIIIPCICFATVSYIQFWVDPAAVPARAALSVIPVLIMCALTDSVYRSVPGARRMWLLDNVQFFVFMCTIAVLHFGAVQISRGVEKQRAAQKAGLKSVEKAARVLVSKAKDMGISLLELVKRVSEEKGVRTQPDDNDVTEDATVSQDAAKTSSADYKQMIKDIKECDLLFIHYVKDVFNRFDKDNSNKVNPSEVRRALAYFDIYLSRKESPALICKFLRDQGQESPEDESGVEVKFTDFVSLLLDVDHYRLKVGAQSVRDMMEANPPSLRLDILAKVIFPLTVITQQIVMNLIVDSY